MNACIRSCTMTCGVAFLVVLAATPMAAVAVGRQSSGVVPSSTPPDLVVMSPTGVERDGLPVFTRRRDSEAYDAVLHEGFAARLLRLYRWEQQFLARRDGTAIEPAYLLLSRNEGGFPRYGFWLDDERKAGVAYVDLHERLEPSGRFGALDQIFPHELMHVIVRQLAGVPPAGSGGANQVHAVGVRTDRITAFDEGFAEHAQVVAVDDPDAPPRTAALRADGTVLANANLRMGRYRRALEARWAPAPPIRMSFVLWFSSAEQVLRYHAVKANLFAHDAGISPERVTNDLYAAYLLENTVPGRAGDPLKPAARLLATEGVVAALFSRWVNDPAMQGSSSDALDARFDVGRVQPGPIERAYLKLFSVLADRRPHDTAALVRAYVASFPDEADAVASVVKSVGLPWPLVDVAEIWLANDVFLTGTTIFDQYRGQPRVHTFDLNAASTVDLLGVPDVSPVLAGAIQRFAPYRSVDDMRRVSGIPDRVLVRFRDMAQRMPEIRAANAREDVESVDMMKLLRPVGIRALGWMLLCSVAAAFMYRVMWRLRVWRLVVNGFAASTVGLMSAWVLGAALQIGDHPVNAAFLVWLPVAVFGLPAALWQLTWRRQPRAAGRDLFAWLLACVPAWLVITPMF